MLEHYCFQIWPPNSIICLHHVQLKRTMMVFQSFLPLHKMQTLVGHNYVICDETPRNKSGLFRWDDLRKYHFQPISNNFGSNFIEHVAKTNGAKPGQWGGISYLWYKNPISVVNALSTLFHFHNTHDRLRHPISTNIPVLLKEVSWEGIRTRGLHRKSLEQCSLCLIFLEMDQPEGIPMSCSISGDRTNGPEGIAMSCIFRHVSFGD